LSDFESFFLNASSSSELFDWTGRLRDSAGRGHVLSSFLDRESTPMKKAIELTLSELPPKRLVIRRMQWQWSKSLSGRASVWQTHDGISLWQIPDRYMWKYRHSWVFSRYVRKRRHNFDIDWKEKFDDCGDAPIDTFGKMKFHGGRDVQTNVNDVRQNDENGAREKLNQTEVRCDEKSNSYNRWDDVEDSLSQQVLFLWEQCLHWRPIKLFTSP
jgi:hypothetical protein